jgi:uncharacterized protein
MLNNLLDPVILCFIVGLLAGLFRSDLRLPEQLYETLSIYLLFAIGIKGGVELANAYLSAILLPALSTVVLGIVIPVIAYKILRIGKIGATDSAAIAAHYGSVSAVTFAVVLAFLHQKGVYFEPFVTVLLVILEIPAIAMGILIARTQGISETSSKQKIKWRTLLHEVFLGKSIYLLVGGLFVGYFSGPERILAVSPLFFTPFKGALAIFLLEMGIITSRRYSDLKHTGVFLVGFGVIMPLISGVLGAVLGSISGLSLGGVTVLATLAASASYIAAPAAMRIALPKANPTLSLTASLGVTFPFNIVLGIPIYFWLASLLHR